MRSKVGKGPKNGLGLTIEQRDLQGYQKLIDLGLVTSAQIAKAFRVPQQSLEARLAQSRQSRQTQRNNKSRPDRALRSESVTTRKMTPKESYEAYLSTPEWHERRRAVHQRDLSCRHCGSLLSLHVHHRTYANFRNERLEDLVLLCNDCHSTLHRLKNDESLTVEEATERFLAWRATP